MAKDQLEHDELNDQDEDQTTATQKEEDDDTNTPDSSDEYDIRSEMDDNDNHVLGLLTDDELAALNGDDEDEEEPEPEPEQAVAQEESPAQAGYTSQDQTQQAQPQQIDLTQEQIEQINAEAKAARQGALDKWRDGDMTDEELQAAIDAAEQSKDEAYVAALEQAEQAEEEARVDQVKASFREVAREYLTNDFPDLAKDEHLSRFDRHVRIITGSNDYEGMTHRQMLEAAHRLYAAEAEALGMEVPAPKQQRAAKRAAPEPEPPKARTKPDTVPTLARVPAAATNSAGDGKWGSIAARYEAAERNGDVAGMEKIMASLSDDEREAFASMDI